MYVCTCVCTFINCFRNPTRPIGPRYSRASSAHAERRYENNIAHLEFTTKTTSVAGRTLAAIRTPFFPLSFSLRPYIAVMYNGGCARYERKNERINDLPTYLSIEVCATGCFEILSRCESSSLFLFLSLSLSFSICLSLSLFLSQIHAKTVNSAPVNPVDLLDTLNR